jgi:hypothetical protein
MAQLRAWVAPQIQRQCNFAWEDISNPNIWGFERSVPLVGEAVLQEIRFASSSLVQQQLPWRDLQVERFESPVHTRDFPESTLLHLL